MARIKLIHTGGTLGMARRGGSWVPAPGHLEPLLGSLAELVDPSLPAWSFYEFDELLDSSNVGPAEWHEIAAAVADRADDCDGFVVIHGTDTMAYTASALSFMLEGLDRPVVLTGSQLPLIHPRTDARENLATSMLVAAHSKIPEVCIYFNGRLLRGNRATKTDTSGFIAFDSPNCDPLGTVGVDIVLHRQDFRPAPTPGTALRVGGIGRSVVAGFRLFPGARAETLRSLLAEPTRGLVLEAFGTGNAPNRDPELLSTLKRATERGVVVVAVTQCLRGRVDLDLYETGAALAAAGVTPGYDLTAEAAMAKLSWLLDRPGATPEQVRAAMVRDLRGELTPPETP